MASLKTRPVPVKKPVKGFMHELVEKPYKGFMHEYGQGVSEFVTRWVTAAAP